MLSDCSTSIFRGLLSRTVSQSVGLISMNVVDRNVVDRMWWTAPSRHSIEI